MPLLKVFKKKMCTVFWRVSLGILSTGSVKTDCLIIAQVKMARQSFSNVMLLYAEYIGQFMRGIL